MLANNPHLPKKRSSKKGLGRSLMRRITEIPESVHRQCSREDKEAGEHASTRNSICTLKKNPFDPAHSAKLAKEETLKSKVFSLKKSYSSYDHVRGQSESSNGSVADAAAAASLLDALMGKQMAKESSEIISAPSESAESVPLVCKSASAHDLSADKKAVPARASMLQKSLSVIASAKEKTLGLTTKAQSSEDSAKKSQPRSRDARDGAEPQREGQPKAPLGQPLQAQQPTACSGLLRGKDLYDLSEVCPWEVQDLPTPSDSKVQKHVSIAPKESTTVHGAATKAGRAPPQKQKGSEPPAARAEVCPWEEQSQCPEAAKQQSLSPAARAPTTTGAGNSSRADVCPWDFPEPPKTADRSADTTKPRKVPSPVEAKGRGAPPDPPRPGGALRLPPSRADVCPWEGDHTAGTADSGQRTPSPSQSTAAKEAPSIKKDSRSRTAEQERSGEEERGRTKAKDKRKPSEKLAEVCPREGDSSQEVLAAEIRRSANVGAAKAKPADVCPWDFQDAAETTDRAAKAGDPASGVASAAKRPDACPWDFEDSTSGKKA